MNLTPHQRNFLDRINAEFTTAFELVNTVSDRKKVTVYGSARINQENPIWKEIEDFSEMLRKDGWMVMTGGGPGVMEAAMANNVSSDLETIALQIDINREKHSTKADLSVKFTDFFVRKYFLRTSDIFIIAPGGFGTMDEAMELLTLLQTKKLKHRRVIFFKKQFWQPLLDWFRDTLLQQGMIAQEDLAIYTVADTAQEIYDQVNKFA